MMKRDTSSIRTVLLAMAAAVVAAGSLAGQTAPAANLRPGDVLRMRIYLEPDMSGDFPVDERGAITLPRIGTVAIADWPSDSIRSRLTTAFAEYLRAPSIEVTLLRRVAVTGAVLKPGLYSVDPSMTISDAVALAGGPAPDGVRDRVELRRDSQLLTAKLTQSSRIADLPLASGDRLFIPQRSWVSRNPWLLSTLIGALATITTFRVIR